MAKNRVLSAPRVTSEVQEIVSLLKEALKRFGIVPEVLKHIKTSLADLTRRVEALEQQQPVKRPKRKR